MREPFNWYIDNNQYLSEAFLQKIIDYSGDATKYDKTLKDTVILHEPTVGNPGSQLTFARDSGIIDTEDKLTDISILYKAGVIDYSNYALAAFSKRNVAKVENIPVKPLVLLAKFFSSLLTLHVPKEEYFITANECKQYLSVLTSYDEYSDDIATTVVSSRVYTNPGNHIPDQASGTPVQWLCIFNLLDSTSLFSFISKTSKNIITASKECDELIRYIANEGVNISLAPTTVGRNNSPLCSYYSNINNGLIEIIPSVPFSGKAIPTSLTRALFNYLFGIESAPVFPWQEYLSSDCFGIYRIFYPIRQLAITKIYIANYSLGECLFDFLQYTNSYTTIISEGHIMIRPPFETTPHHTFDDMENHLVFETGLDSKYQRNRIVFGAPGTGKSFTLNTERIDLLQADSELNYERVTFHPDYTYANFVGSYKPVPVENSVSYEFVPGPFMRIYVKALRSARNGEKKPFLLLVEEINRADVAAVFGDVFQLLDRGNNNVSEYPIQASEDVKKYLAKPNVLGGAPNDYSFISIPDNMFIWATMNSADQGVFPMDTAFKRRWNFSYIGINKGENKIENCVIQICDKQIKWNLLRKAINRQMIAANINEDKLLGPFFIPLNVLPKSAPGDDDFPVENEAFLSAFENKVIMYLFSDAVKQKPSSVFSAGSDNSVNIRQYSSLCEAFRTKGIGIFVSEISNETLL